MTVLRRAQLMPLVSGGTSKKHKCRLMSQANRANYLGIRRFVDHKEAQHVSFPAEASILIPHSACVFFPGDIRVGRR